jgi:hypothetical protein
MIKKTTGIAAALRSTRPVFEKGLESGTGYLENQV